MTGLLYSGSQSFLRGGSVRQLFHLSIWDTHEKVPALIAIPPEWAWEIQQREWQSQKRLLDLTCDAKLSTLVAMLLHREAAEPDFLPQGQVKSLTPISLANH